MVPAVGFEPTCAPVLSRRRRPVPPRWEWSARGDSNPDLHGLNVPRLPIAPRADGDHGRTRTATGQALDLLPLPDWATWPLVPLGGLEPPPRGLRARHAPLTLQRGVGANGGIRTRTSRLGGPAGYRYQHIRFGSAYGYRTRPSALATRDAASTPRPNVEPVSFTGPSTFRQLSKTPLLRAWWAARDSNPNAPVGENGVTARQRTIRTYRPYGDSARIRTRTHELWRLGCSRYTTLPMSLHVSTVFEDRSSL
jgi:hypothetical protein